MTKRRVADLYLPRKCSVSNDLIAAMDDVHPATDHMLSQGKFLIEVLFNKDHLKIHLSKDTRKYFVQLGTKTKYLPTVFCIAYLGCHLSDLGRDKVQKMNF